MKCPKCGYLGFEDVDRCRNCGYDFSLTAAPDIPDLTIRRDTRALTPLDDLSLIDSATGDPDKRTTDIGAGRGRVFGAPDVAPPARPMEEQPLRQRPAAAAAVPAAAVSAAAPHRELTLFGPPIPD